jgi:PAS domain S-box-containing protein
MMSAIKRNGDWPRLVVEGAPNAMLMTDSDRRILFVNRATERIFGYVRPQLVGRQVEFLIPERNRAAHPGLISEFLASPNARAMGAGRELYGRRADGSEVPIEISLNPIHTSEGLFTLASIVDLTERKRAEGAFERLAAIIEHSEDAILSKSLDGVITSWNRGAERLFGYLEQDVVGSSIAVLVPERLIDDEMRAMNKVRTEGRLNLYETVRRRKDGSEVDVSVRLSPMLNAAGAIVGVSSIVRDITDVKRRAVELQRSNVELEQFAYVASHDLQEPLRMVVNYTELLAQRYQGKLDDKADKYIFYAADGARRMQRLVADLLAYSRVGLQGKPLVPVDTAVIVARVVKSMQNLIDETATTLEFDMLPVVLADEIQLQQLFQNLISNAIKFRSAAAPRICLGAEQIATLWTFSVSDNGIGVDAQFADRIFQMFQRLHEVGKYQGSGIGLSIAKRIVERHGGAIWIESNPGAGTTFRFTLQPALRRES